MRKEYVDERIEFKEEVKKMLYEKSGNRCAFCGVKLTEENRSLDHGVPLAHGGTNDLRNIVPLCKKHNEEKADLFYWPMSYYTYLLKTGKRSVLCDMNNYVAEWLTNWLTREDIVEFPLVADIVLIWLCPFDYSIKMKNKNKFLDAFMWEITELNRDEHRTQIWELTGVQGRDIRKSVMYTDQDYSLIVLRKKSSGAWGMLMSMQITQSGDVYMSEVWRGISPQMAASMPYMILTRLWSVWVCSKVECRRVFIPCKNKSTYTSLCAEDYSSMADVCTFRFGCSYKRNLPDKAAERWGYLKEYCLIVEFDNDAISKIIEDYRNKSKEKEK